MNKETRRLVEENNCLEEFRHVDKIAHKEGLHIVIYKDYDAEFTTWEFFSIEARNDLGEPIIWVANSCLYDGLVDMEERIKELPVY